MCLVTVEAAVNNFPLLVSRLSPQGALDLPAVCRAVGLLPARSGTGCVQKQTER